MRLAQFLLPYCRILPWLAFATFASAQDTLPLTDLSFWKAATATNWQVAGNASAALTQKDVMTAAKGTGVLINLPDEKNRANLVSAREYGDVDVAFDFMMAHHSNSGFYLQGRYEVQLMDSWGVQNPAYGDCGGVYARRRWNPKEEMFDGSAPRLNACLAPGLWQRMEISFQAPRFDAAGKKTTNARLLKVMLNGVTIHENLELTGPTGGPIAEQEVATGPFMIQGDHGPVAFRNFKINDRQGQPVMASAPFDYQVIYGEFRAEKDFAGKKADLKGQTDKLSWEVAKRENAFAVLFTGNIKVPKAGKHRITLQNGGRSSLKVNGKELLADAWTWYTDGRSVDVELPMGTTSLALTTYKIENWMTPFLGLWVEGPGSRATALHRESATLAAVPRDPILMNAEQPRVFRSFMDIAPPRGEKKRVVHAVQVGDPSHLHYTYDLDNGAVAQIWKGDFLNVAPMWDDRGDGSSRPRGSILGFDDASVVVSKAELFNLKPSEFAPVEHFRPQGYDLDKEGRPTFRYKIDDMEVEDQMRVTDQKYFTRSLTFQNVPANTAYVCRLAVGSTIEKSDDNTYAVDGRRYYLQLPAGSKPVIEQSGGLSVLYVPMAAKVEYGLMW